MEKDTNSNSDNKPLKSKIYFITGYIFLMAMALAWSVDSSIVYIFFGIAVYFLFLGFYSRPSVTKFQEPFKTTGNRGGGTSATFADSFANIFQKTGAAHKPSAKIFARPPAPDANRGIVGLVVAGVFLMFIIFFVGSVLFSSSDGWDDSTTSFETAQNYFLNGNYDSAYLLYGRAWKANEQNIGAMVGYGKVLAIRNQQDSAIIMFDKALAINPDYLDASYNKALAYYNQNNFGQSISVLTPVLEENIDYYDAMLLIGDSYYEQKQFDDAMNWYKKAYEEGGIRSRALCHLMAYIFDTKGDYSKAIDLYKEALSYDSTVVDIYQRLGELLPNDEGNFYRTQAVKLKQN